MRQLTPPTNIVLALVFAACLVAALGLPWYAVPDPNALPAATDGPVERGAATVARWFGASGSPATGAETLQTAETILLGLAAATVALALLMLIPALRNPLRDPAKIVPLATPVVVLAQMFSAPAGMEIRYGVFVAMAASLLMANSAFHGAELPARTSSARPRRPAADPAGPRGAR